MSHVAAACYCGWMGAGVTWRWCAESTTAVGGGSKRGVVTRESGCEAGGDASGKLVSLLSRGKGWWWAHVCATFLCVLLSSACIGYIAAGQAARLTPIAFGRAFKLDSIRFE